MEREQIIEEIISLHNGMFPLFIKHGIPRTLLAFKSKNLQYAADDQLLYVLAWLRNLKEKEYRAIEKAWALVTEDTWKYYEDMEMTDMQEQMILKDSIDTAKRAWKDRPVLLDRAFKILGNEAKVEVAKTKKRKKNETQSENN